MTQWEENNKIIDDLRIEKQTKNYGVYAIRLLDNKLLNNNNIEERKIYIGYSKNVKDRWRDEIYKAFKEILHSKKSQIKLNREIVNKIRNDFMNGDFSFADFARIYNVQNSLIGRIIYNTGWHDEKYNPDIKLIKQIIKNLKSKLAIKNLEKINSGKINANE